MITKYAEFAVLSVERASGEVIREAEEITRQAAVTAGFQRESHRADFAYDRRPGFIYVRSRAISSRTNDNYDDFPAGEIKKAWRTFIGKPVFVNHHNANHRRARGFVIDAAIHEDTNPDGSPDTWVEVLMEVDAVRFPRLAEAVIRGDIARTSMGTDVAYSICTACNNRAETPADYCRHIPAMKGMKIRRVNSATGRHEEVLIAETCYGLGFFENSLLVEEPADPTAFTLGAIEAEWESLPENLRAMASVVDREGLVDGIVASLTKQADEDQCPHCAGDSLMAQGKYICESGHIWDPASPAAHAFHDGPGVLQPITSLLGLQVETLLAEAEQITQEAVTGGRWSDFLDLMAGGRDPETQCMECGSLFRWNPALHKFVCPAGHDTFPHRLHDEDWNWAMGSQRTGLGETKAPAQVNTLRVDRCPVCKDDEAFNGEKCSVCGYVQPPEHFRDPDLTKAREMDLRQDQAEEAGAADPSIDPNAIPTQPGDTSMSDELGDQPDLQCDNCGEIFSAEGDDPSAPDDLSEDPAAATAPVIPEDSADPNGPSLGDPDDLDDLADKSDKDLGLEDEDEEDESSNEDKAEDPSVLDPTADDPLATGEATPTAGDAGTEDHDDPNRDNPKDPHGGDPLADEGDPDPLDENTDTADDVVPNGPCPICGQGTLLPMDSVATARTTEDVDDQQVIDDPTRAQTV